MVKKKKKEWHHAWHIVSNSQLTVNISDDIKTPSFFCVLALVLSDCAYLIQLSRHRGNTTLPMNTFCIHFFLRSINKLLSYANNYILQTNDESLHWSSLCTLVLMTVFTEFLGIHRHIASTPRQVASLSAVFHDDILIYMLCKAYYFMKYAVYLVWLSHTTYPLILTLSNNFYLLWFFPCTWNMYMASYILCFLQSHSFYFHLFNSVRNEDFFRELPNNWTLCLCKYLDEHLVLLIVKVTNSQS